MHPKRSARDRLVTWACVHAARLKIRSTHELLGSIGLVDGKLKASFLDRPQVSLRRNGNLHHCRFVGGARLSQTAVGLGGRLFEPAATRPDTAAPFLAQRFALRHPPAIVFFLLFAPSRCHCIRFDGIGTEVALALSAGRHVLELGGDNLRQRETILVELLVNVLLRKAVLVGKMFYKRTPDTLDLATLLALCLRAAFGIVMQVRRENVGGDELRHGQRRVRLGVFVHATQRVGHARTHLGVEGLLAKLFAAFLLAGLETGATARVADGLAQLPAAFGLGRFHVLAQLATLLVVLVCANRVAPWRRKPPFAIHCIFGDALDATHRGFVGRQLRPPLRRKGCPCRTIGSCCTCIPRPRL